jgi:hypothetical protein
MENLSEPWMIERRVTTRAGEGEAARRVAYPTKFGYHESDFAHPRSDIDGPQSRQQACAVFVSRYTLGSDGSSYICSWSTQPFRDWWWTSVMVSATPNGLLHRENEPARRREALSTGRDASPRRPLAARSANAPSPYVAGAMIEAWWCVSEAITLWRLRRP